VRKTFGPTVEGAAEAAIVMAADLGNDDEIGDTAKANANGRRLQANDPNDSMNNIERGCGVVLTRNIGDIASCR